MWAQAEEYKASLLTDWRKNAPRSQGRDEKLVEINIWAKHELTRARVSIGSAVTYDQEAAGDQNMKLCLTGGWRRVASLNRTKRDFYILVWRRENDFILAGDRFNTRFSDSIQWNKF